MAESKLNSIKSNNFKNQNYEKNKFFAGVIVLLFVLSFSVSQVLLAGDRPPSSEIGEVTFPALCAQYNDVCWVPPFPGCTYWEGWWPFENVW